MATELGVGYLSLLPSMRDFRAAASKEATKAGEQAGQTFDAGFAGGLRKSRRGDEEIARKAKDSRQSAKQAADGIARDLAVAGGAAAVGVGLAVKKFADFDAGMSDVRAATHETAAGMDDLREAALQAGADTAFSATEAAAGEEALAKAGVTTKDILSGGLAGALDLAAAGNLGVAESAETAATALTQFHLSGEDIPHLADLLAAGAGKAQGEVSDLSASLNQSGLVASQFGLSIEETVGTLSAFASAGLLGSDAGTSFKTMLLALANPSNEASELMDELGIRAYDVQGAFVGIGPLAEQLKTKLGGLSQAERDAALATIFGSDAIRSANVLYQQGSKGIGDWTNKVNDAGFAAETAAIKQDNLKGDIEKLGGSFETALIGAGSGANDVLRGLAQTAGNVLNIFTKLPDGVQATATILGSVAAVGGLSAAGLLKAVTAAGELKEAWTSLGRTGRGLTFAMGGLGIALTAAAVIYTIFTKKNADAARKSDELRDTLDQQTGAITQNTRAYVANDLAQSGLSKRAKDLGLDLSLVTDAALGNKPALNDLVGVLDRTIAAGQRQFVAGNRAGTALTDEARAALALKNELVGTNGALTDATEKTKLAAEGAKVHKTAQQQQKAATDASNKATKEQAELLKKQVEAAYEAAGGALSLRDAENRYQESLDAVNDSLKENGRTLDVHTPKGRANRETLDAIANSANNWTESLLANGVSNEAAGRSAENARKNFVNVGIRMGLNKKAAQELAEKLIAIPPKATTNVTNNAAGKPKTDVLGYSDLLTGRNKAGIPHSVSTGVAVTVPRTTVQTYADLLTGRNRAGIPDSVSTGVRTTGIPNAQAQIDGFVTHVDKSLGGIADESVTVSLFTKNAPGGHVPVERAFGGPIPGWSPTKTADNVLVASTAGEHMWTVDEVNAAGGHGAVEALRAMALAGQLQSLATGGKVGIGVTSATQSLAGIAGVMSVIAHQFRAEIARQRAALPLGFAQSQSGKPYIWGAAGPAGYDCSGFMAAITNFILGRNPYSRLGSTETFPWPMFAPGYGNFSIGSFKGSPGHMAGTLNGINVESRGGQGVVIGSSARGASNALFGGNVYHLKGYAQGGEILGDLPFDLFDPRGKRFDVVRPKVFDGGGQWDSGVVGVNLSGQTETVRNASQEADLHRPIHVTVPIQIGDEVTRIVRFEIDTSSEFAGTVRRMGR